MKRFLLAIDQGTTSSRAIVFDTQPKICGVAQQEFSQHFPADGWVEHEVDELWSSTLSVCKQALVNASVSAEQIAGIGITNQRETTLLWDRKTGKALARAIVWQDRRTADYCEQLKAQGHEAMVEAKTGLLLDPYFSATKLKWLLDEVPDARARAQRGELAFGTVDSYLIWQLSGGATHKTDATNASRTMLFNIHEQQWDEELLALFDIPRSLLPQVCDSAHHFCDTLPELLGVAIPVAGVAGDQQAALVGQACFSAGMAKSTYGTGCFLMINTGEQAIKSTNRLLTTVAYRLQGKTCYALEGSIFVAGAAVQWLRDGLKLIESAAQSSDWIIDDGDTKGVYMVPAFTGLGAPYWDPHARGALLGLTRDSGIAEVVTATLQSVCLQTMDLMQAIDADGQQLQDLRVDGGMVVNDWLVQELANTLNVSVSRPQLTETTALGAAYLAGLQLGMYASLDEVAKGWAEQAQFLPNMNADTRKARYQGWLQAVARVRTDKTDGEQSA